MWQSVGSCSQIHNFGHLRMNMMYANARLIDATIVKSCLSRSDTVPYVVLDIRVYDCERVCTCRTLSVTLYLEC